MTKLLYGMKISDKRIVSIDEVPDNEVGLACNCVCASCGKILQACSLQGKVRRYFRHHSNNSDINCNAVFANETALHLMAKQIIVSEKKIFIPSRSISLHEAGIDDLPEQIKKDIDTYEYQKSKVVQGMSVLLEKHLDNFTPDVILNTHRGELLIEIYVRHRVDLIKKQKVIDYGAPMIEINLSSFAEKSISREELQNIIMNDNELITWISYPISKSIINKAILWYESQDVVKKYRVIQKCKKEKEKEYQEKKELYRLLRGMNRERQNRINRDTEKQMERLLLVEQQRKENQEKETFRKNYEDVLNRFDKSNEIIIDSFGIEWYRCEDCREIISEYDVAFLFPNNPKSAKCKKCYYK